MMFLLPAGGIVDGRFGIMTTPAMRGVPAGIQAGLPWAGDNGAYSGSFDPTRFLAWLDVLKPYRPTCLFITVPDRVWDAAETLRLFAQWQPKLPGWPLAFVAQDGQEALDLPPSNRWAALFVGGSTRWKLSDAAVSVIQRAQALGQHIHIGRVNWYRRYQHFAGLPGAEGWTCDGTRLRYGRDQALSDWGAYMAAPQQLRLPVSGGGGDGMTPEPARSAADCIDRLRLENKQLREGLARLMYWMDKAREGQPVDVEKFNLVWEECTRMVKNDT